MSADLTSILSVCADSNDPLCVSRAQSFSETHRLHFYLNDSENFWERIDFIFVRDRKPPHKRTKISNVEAFVVGDEVEDTTAYLGFGAGRSDGGNLCGAGRTRAVTSARTATRRANDHHDRCRKLSGLC